MRSHRPRWSIRLWALGLFTLVLAGVPALAQAQQSIDPTATPVRNTGCWVYWMAQGAIALSILILILAGAAYLRFAPRFQRDSRAAEAKLPTHAPPVTEVRLQSTPPPAPVEAPVPAGVAATPTAAASPASARSSHASTAPALWRTSPSSFPKPRRSSSSSPASATRATARGPGS